MINTIDESGNVHGRLTVLRQATGEEMNEAKKRRKNACWVCQCECGRVVIVMGRSLRSGQTKSCGCLVREKSTENLRAWYRAGNEVPTKLPRGIGAMRALIHRYKSQARARKLIWSLTEAEFAQLTSSPCCY